MKLDKSSAAGGVNRFRTTRWSVVLASAESQAPGCKDAFSDLCKLYWYPLYAFIRKRGNSPEDAQDLVQGFLLHLLEQKTLRRVDRLRGKFRSFLLASLQNYLSNEADRARCLKRGGKVEFIYLDVEEAEDRYGLEAVDELTPEKIFIARWAMALLGEATSRLSREYSAQGRATIFQALVAFLDPVNAGSVPGAYIDASNVYHGFVRAADGTVTTFDVAAAGTGSGEGTLPEAINQGGTITGIYIDANFVFHGFVRAPDGAITTFDPPGAGTGPGQGTLPSSINQTAITGDYLDASNVYHGFIVGFN